MDVTRNTLLALVLAVTVLTTGCISSTVGNSTNDPATATQTNAPATDAPTTDVGSTESDDEATPDMAVEHVDSGPALADNLPEPAACGESGWVGYWGTNDVDDLWGDGSLHVGWTVPPNQSTLFVAFENTTPVGVDHVQYDTGVTADGAAVPVENATGEGTYAVAMILDVNGNGEYDPGTDRPCKSDGDDPIVMSSWLWVDWLDD